MKNRYKIIRINDFIYAIDPKAECPKGSWITFTETKDGAIIAYLQPIKSTLDYAANGLYNFLVVASSDKSLGLPLLPEVEEIDVDLFSWVEAKQIFFDKIGRNPILENDNDLLIVSSVQEGYKAALVNKFTKENMWRSYVRGFQANEEKKNPLEDFKDVLQNVSSKPPIAVEVEMEDAFNETYGEIRGFYPEVDEKRFVKVVKWIYE